MRALVIGGTGPTGPAIVRGLLERGYEVTILHRGTNPCSMPWKGGASIWPWRHTGDFGMSRRPQPNYEAEDALATIHRDSLERMQSVDIETASVYHPYPHPRKAGLERDHRRR